MSRLCKLYEYISFRERQNWQIWVGVLYTSLRQRRSLLSPNSIHYPAERGLEKSRELQNDSVCEASESGREPRPFH